MRRPAKHAVHHTMGFIGAGGNAGEESTYQKFAKREKPSFSNHLYPLCNLLSRQVASEARLQHDRRQQITYHTDTR